MLLYLAAVAAVAVQQPPPAKNITINWTVEPSEVQTLSLLQRFFTMP
jgi:hypothetical protein